MSREEDADDLRALDVEIAERYGGYYWEETTGGIQYLRPGAQRGYVAMRLTTGVCYYLDGLPRYSSDLDLMWQVEEEIKRRDLYAAYILALGWDETIYTYGALFDITHIRADVRARAAILVANDRHPG